MQIVKILKRHSPGCFDVEDSDGNQYTVQLAFKIEEAWKAAQLPKPDCDCPDPYGPCNPSHNPTA